MPLVGNYLARRGLISPLGGEQVSDEKQLSRDEHIEGAKAVYDLLQYIRVNGGFRSKSKIEAILGVSLGVDTLQDIERAAKRADISKRAAYTEKGLLYGLSLHRGESGYRFTYLFMCKNE